MKLHVVAEGVETEEQSRFLGLLNCDEMQGYFFCKPLPVDEFEARYMFADKPGHFVDRAAEFRHAPSEIL
jgi:EAL domain-containing protein (putative c-di-GMP-specific phosphodiesterase class I)